MNEVIILQYIFDYVANSATGNKLLGELSNENTPVAYKWYTVDKTGTEDTNDAKVTFINKYNNKNRLLVWSRNYNEGFHWSIYPPQNYSKTDISGTDNTCAGVYYEYEGIGGDVIAIKSNAGAYSAVLVNNSDTEIFLGRNGTTRYCQVVSKALNTAYTDNSTLFAYIAAIKTLGMGLSNNYSAQPIVINGIKTPLYSIVSNTASADPELFTEITVGGQRFFVVDYGVGVRI